MSLFLSELPLALAAVLLVLLPTLISMGGPILVRRHVELHRLTTNNEIAGFKFATVGVIYAVILAFAVISVWEKYSEAEVVVTEEAAAAATLYRLTTHTVSEAGAAKAALSRYLRTAIEFDWPQMAIERESREARLALTDLYRAVMALPQNGSTNAAAFAEMLHQLDTLTQARRTRLRLASGIVPAMVWVVLTLGAALTIVFTFFFGTKNLWAQVAMTGILSLLVFMGLLVVLSFDHPFTGPVHVGPEAIQTVLEEFG